METLSSGFEAEDLFRCLKTGLAGLTAEECDRLENYVLNLGHPREPLAPGGGLGGPSRRAMAREWSDADRQELAEINALRQRVRQPFLLLRDGMKAAETAAGKVEALYRFLESVKLQQSLEEQRTRLAEAGLLQRGGGDVPSSGRSSARRWISSWSCWARSPCTTDEFQPAFAPGADPVQRRHHPGGAGPGDGGGHQPQRPAHLQILLPAGGQRPCAAGPRRGRRHPE